MENGQIPPIQPANMGAYSANAGGLGTQMPPVNGPGVTMNSAQTILLPQKDKSGLVKTIVIIILSLVAATFIGLFVWMYVQYDTVRTDVEGQINVAVAKAEEEQATKLEEEFLEREKDPWRDFSGPADYGELSFKYPKTWSVYVAKDAAFGGDFEAYFNPLQVDEVSDENLDALRLSILDESFDDVVAEYQKDMEKKDSNLTMESREVNGITMNRYTGTIPDTEFSGVIVIFKIRDKTVIMQTDAMNFVEDFDTILGTITFNA